MCNVLFNNPSRDLFSRAFAQQCPKENPAGPAVESETVTLSGRIVYHDEIRKWIELHLEKPSCVVDSVQLLAGGGGAFEVDEGNFRSLEVFRGCTASVTGQLGLPGTGYYSADLYLSVPS